jgi:hypothetical protein
MTASKESHHLVGESPPQNQEVVVSHLPILIQAEMMNLLRGMLDHILEAEHPTTDRPPRKGHPPRAGPLPREDHLAFPRHNPVHLF